MITRWNYIILNRTAKKYSFAVTKASIIIILWIESIPQHSDSILSLVTLFQRCKSLSVRKKYIYIMELDEDFQSQSQVLRIYADFDFWVVISGLWFVDSRLFSSSNKSLFDDILLFVYRYKYNHFYQYKK